MVSENDGRCLKLIKVTLSLDVERFFSLEGCLNNQLHFERE